MKSLLFTIFAFFTSYSGFSQELPEKLYAILEDQVIVPDTTVNDFQTWYTLKKGDKLVFHFRQQTKNFDRTIAYDVGYRLDFYFQIPADADYFEFEGEELKEVMAFSQPFCRCVPSQAYYEEGTIQGRKLNENEWEVHIQLSGQSPQKKEKTYTIETSGIFQKERP